jgi:hypothetical protein
MIKLLQKQTNVSARERKDARRQEDDVTLWRDYHTFLKAKMTLLEVRIAESRVAFERTDSLELEAEQAHAALDRIPAGIRAMFESVLEERRQRVQAELEAEARSRGSGGRSRQIDPDIVDRRALAELLAEAEGRSRRRPRQKATAGFRAAHWAISVGTRSTWPNWSLRQQPRATPSPPSRMTHAGASLCQLRLVSSGSFFSSCGSCCHVARRRATLARWRPW